MTTDFTAVYENGVLRPNVPLSLAEGQRVAVTVRPITAAAPRSEDEAIHRIESATTLEELFAAMNEAPDDGDDYDLLEALNENRRRAGARLLYPPDMKGTTW